MPERRRSPDGTSLGERPQKGKKKMTMRLWTIPVLVGLLVAAACGVGFAIPSLDGPTGIVTTPDTQVERTGSVDAALSYQKTRTTELVQSAGLYGAAPTFSERGHDMTAWSIQGLTGVSDNAEAWMAYHAIRDHADSHIWGLGAKMQFATEPEKPISIAAGLGYQQWSNHFTQSLIGAGPATVLVDNLEDLKVWNAYLVASKDLSMKRNEKPRWGLGGGTHLLANAGVMYIKLDGTSSGSGSNSLTRPFLSAELVGGNTEAAIEYRFSEDSIDQKAVFSALIRQRFSPDVSLEIGTTNADPVGVGLNDQEIFIRLGYLIPNKSVL